MKKVFLAPGLAAVALTIGGCASTSATPDTPAEADAVTVTNCDRDVSVPGTPERILSLYPSMTELLIELGAADAVVGQSNTNLSAPSPELADEFAAIPVLSTGVPAKEAVVSARPDLIVSDGEYWFDGERMQTMDELAELGIPIFVNSGYCHQEVTEGRIDDVFSDLDSLGRLLGKPDRAAELADEAQTTLDAVSDRISGQSPTRTVMVQVAEGQSYALARGLYSSVLGAAGGQNLFEDELPAGKYFGQVSTESIIEKRPDVIVVVHGADADPAAAEEDARTLFAGTPAAAQNRIHAVPEAVFAGELRSVDGAAELSELLHPRG
ncbi:ABC transporter substrate-binding protein [Rhodococcus triatomae]|nr:ABC transporter substrate-binding protein [Rhodococcus triatomae BKS 15-14]